ncbi:hypothetical protein CGC21_1685 [Leishmania donovani]|uniref:DUF7623 domain-containing protein n=1 Tax=Leishmania donovani TaxID=5661 RepID=A0A504XJ10_LEIDO|nr:hypothetical protein CGC21_1685 [Leishmania donovani]
MDIAGEVHEPQDEAKLPPSDPYYQELVALRASLVREDEAVTQTAFVCGGADEDRVAQLNSDAARARAAEMRAEAALKARYPFLGPPWRASCHGGTPGGTTPVRGSGGRARVAKATPTTPRHARGACSRRQWLHGRTGDDASAGRRRRSGAAVLSGTVRTRVTEAVGGAVFASLAARHAGLLSDPAANREPLADVEDLMRHAVPMDIAGERPYYQELVALRASLVREDEAVNADSIRCVEEQMKDRVAQLNSDAARARAAEMRAEAALKARYPFLGPTVAGELLTAVRLEDDAVFVGLAAEHASLKATPTTPRQALACVEQGMRARASELVAEHARDEEALRERLPFVGALPGGVTLRELDMANDPDGLHERFPFLPEEPVPGVSLVEARVMDDPEFRTLANELVDLRRGAEASPQALRAAEEALAGHAAEVAAAKLRATEEAQAHYPFLSKRVAGVPLSELPLAQDELFQALVAQRAPLLGSPRTNAARLHAVEARAHDRARELADAKRKLDSLRDAADDEVRSRNPFLPHSDVRGVPLRELGLSRDPEYARLMDRRLTLKERPVENAAELTAAAMLSSLGLSLDPRLAQLEQQCVALADQPKPDRAVLRAAEEAAAVRVQELVDEDASAEEEAAQARAAVLKRYPMCARDVTEAVGKDAVFASLAARHAGLLSDPAANREPLADVEDLMRQRGAEVESGRRQRRRRRPANPPRLLDMNDVPMDIAGEVHEPQDEAKLPPRSRHAAALRHSDPYYQELVALRASLVREDEAVNADSIRCVEEQMKDRVAQLNSDAARARAAEMRAEAALKARYPFLGPTVAGELLTAVRLEDDAVFVGLAAEHASLKATPTTPRQALACVEQGMRARASELVAEHARDEEALRERLPFVGALPGGVTLRELDMANDPDGLHERFPFLPEEPVPGVSLVEARVMDDPEFRTLANELVDLRRGAEASPQALRAAEEALAGHAAEVAAAKLRATEEAQAHYPFLSKRVAGVPLSELPLAQDELFQALVAQRAPLLGSPRTNAARLHAVEARAHDRARELADAKRKLDSLRDAADDEVRSRNPFLPHSDVRGVPLRELGLSRDPEYARLMDRRLTLKERPVENAAELTAAAMLSSLGLSLDPRLAQLEQQCVALADQPKPDRAVLRAAEEAAAVRVQELVDEDASAEEEAAQARAAVLKRYPMCARDVTEAVGKDAVFASLAARHAGLLSDPAANREPLADVEDLMRQRGAEVESGRRQRRRRRPANPPRLLDMNDVPMDIAGEVHEPQDEAKLPPRSRHAAALRHSDPYYQELVALRASLVREDEAVNADSIRCVEEQMKDRVAQLNSDAARARAAEMRAEAALKARYPFLGPTVAGELLTAVRLEDDAVFVGLAAEHASLKATPTTPRQALACVEQGMRARASELVAEHARDEEALRERLPFVGALPGGVTLRELDMANDPDGLHERFPFLPEEPVPGVSLVEARVMDDPEFRTLANELVDLRRGAEASPQALRAAEEALAGHAAEVAAAKLRATEEAQAHYPFLSKRVAGVPLSELPLAQDELFQALVAQRAPLLGSPRTNAARLHAVEARAHDRARELADAKRKLDSLRDAADDEVRSRNPFLPHSDVRGVPLRELGLSRDPEYARLMDRRLTLKERPVENAAELTAAAMLSSLGLSLDPRLAQLEQQCVALADQPKPDRAVLRAAEEAAAVRVQELVDEDASAEEEAAQARAAVLKRYPMCARDVTEAVGKDAVFASLAARHAGLLSDPAANREPLADVEDLMRQRGAEVESGRRQRRRRRPANPPRLLDMNDVPMDIAGEVHEPQDEAKLPPRSRHAAALRHSDPYYQELVALRASLVREDEAVNADSIRCVEEQMKDRVAQLNSDAARARAAEMRAEAALKARYPFLGPTVAGELLTAVRLEDDAVFVGLAAEHASLKATPTTPRQALACVEQGMRARASELVAEHARDEEALRERLPFVGALPGGVTLRELDMANDPDGLHERFPFLPEEPVPGVSLVEARVMDDPEFRTLANELVDLRRGAEASPQALRAAEEALAGHAAEVAAAKLRATEEAQAHYPFLSKRVAGVPLSELPLAQDELFQALVAQRAPLLGSPRTNAARLHAVEARAHDRARELADAKRKLDSLRDAADDEVRSRNPFLPHSDVRGVPLRELGLSRDPEYARLMDRRLTLKERPVENAAELTAAAMLSSLGLSLDPRLAQLEQQCVALADQPKPDRAVLRAAEEAAAVRVQELVDEDASAEEEAAQARAAVLKRYPMCARDVTEAVGKDAVFASLAARHAGLLSDPAANREPLADVEDLMRQRGAEVESGRRQRRRRRPANPPRLLDMNDVPMDIAGEVHEPQDEAKLPPRSRHAAALRHSDPHYQELVALRASLVREDEAVNADSIRCVEEQMKDRVAQLNSDAARARAAEMRAEAALKARYPFLGPTVAGELLTAVRLEDDAVFVGLAAEHASLKATPTTPRQALACVEQGMRARASELVAEHARDEEALRERLPFVGALPGGVTLRELDMANDPDGLHERFPFLPEEPVPGVSLVEARVMDDPEFRTLANELVDLRRGAEASPQALRAAEEALAGHAAEVAAAKLRATEEAQAHYPFLSKRVAGVPLSELPLAQDELFQALVAQRAPLLGSPRTNAARLHAVEARAHDRARELADAKRKLDSLRDAADDEVRSRNPFLPHSDVRGVPLRELGLSRDPEYARLMDRRLTLKERPVENAAELTAAAMLSSLGLSLDPRLAQLEQQCVALADQPKPDRAVLRAAEEAAAVRVQELVDEDASAEEEAAQARAAVLKRYPMCARDVTEAVGKDAVFASLAARHAGLMSDPAANREPLADVEDLMRQRGAEVESGRRQRRRRRPANPPRLLDMNDVPMDIAGEVHEPQDEAKLPPRSRHAAALRHSDPHYQELVALRASLVREDEAVNADSIRCVEEQMKDRVAQLNSDAARARAAEMRAEAALKARYPFLGPTVAGELLTAVRLEDDAVFVGLAAEHASLKATPTTPRQALACVEQGMRARASELVAEHARDEEALRERLPFVGALPGGVTLRELDMANDPDGLHERFPFLPEEPVPGVSLVEARVMDDPEFRTLANELVDLRRGAEASPQALRAAEEALAGHAAEVAAAKLRATEEAQAHYPFLSKRVAGVPLSELPLAQDELFQALVAQRAPLLGSPRTNAARLHAVEARAHDRARELADAKRKLDSLRDAADDEVRSRNPFLPHSDVRGVPLRELGLSRDPEYARLMDRRLTLKERPVENAAELTAAAMLSSLGLSLDPRLAQLEQQCVALADQPKPDRAVLRAAEEAAAVRVQELVDEDASAEEEAAQARAAVLKRYPMCARDVTEAVGKDAVFASLAARHAGLLSDPAANREPLADVEDLMRQRGAEVESGRRQRRRRRPANPPRLLDMNDVPMDIAGEVHEPQDEAKLPPRSRHAAALRHSDPYYQELVALRASLVREDEAVNADSIRCVEEQMKDRVAQLNSDAARARAAEMRAEAALKARYPFLGPTVAGELLTAVRLEDDAVFVGLAAEHASLKATPTTPRQALACVEQGMRARASELVAEHARDEEALRERLPFVGALPGGVTLRELDMANDPDGLHERFPFLPEEPVPGVSLVEARVMDDPEFRTLANALVDLRRDSSVKETAEIVFQQSMAEVAIRLASDKLRATEEAQAHYPFLSKRVAGVPLSELPLAQDELFQALVAQRAPLLGSPRTNAARLHAVEARAHDRARELAVEAKAIQLFRMDESDAVRARHPYLPHSDILLVPLREIAVHSDRKLQRLGRRRLQLKGAGSVDVSALALVESEMRERVGELAGRIVAAEMKGRRRFLPRQRRSVGVVFAALHIPEDEEIVEWRLDVMENPDCDADDEAVAKKAIRRRGSALLDAYLEAEADIARELHQLRRRFPTCVRDVNPSIELDDYFATLRGAYADWVAFMDEEEPSLIQIQEEMRARSVALIGDDRCVADALNNYCVAEAELRLAKAHRKPSSQVARLRRATDVAQSKHRLWSRRQARRHVTAPLFDFPVNEGDFIDDDDADSWVEEDTYAAHSRAAHAKACMDSHFLYLQRQKATLTAGGHRSGARCVSELLKRRLRQLTGDAARLQRSRKRRDNAILRQYPFLQSRYFMSVPLSELRLDEDDEFMRLAAERDRLLQPPSDLRARYPFLPAVINGVPIEELGLEADPEFMRLASQREDLIGPLRAKLKSVKDREEAMRIRVIEHVAAHVARENHLRDTYPFLDAQKLPVHLQRLYLEHDVQFQRLYAEYARLRGSAAGDDASMTTATIATPKAGRCSRVSSIASSSSLASPRPHAKTVAQKQLEKRMREWVMRLAEEEAEWEFANMMDLESLADRFPFLPVEPLPGIHLGEIDAFVDVRFCSMAAELELARKNIAPPAVVATAEAALLSRVMQLAEEKHMKTVRCRQRHPPLPRRVGGVLIGDIDLPVCGEFAEASEEALLESYYKAAGKVKARRICNADEDEAVRSRHPFLEMNDVHGVPLRYLPLSDDSIYLSYLRKWRAVLSAEPIDREKLRIYEDLLRECAEEQALRIIDVNAAMANRLSQLQVMNVVPAALPLLDLHNILVRARDVLVAEHKSGVIPPPTVEDLELLAGLATAFASAWEDVVQELTALRRRFPWSVRDVNPALQHDATFQQLEAQRQSLLATFNQMELMESLETEERKRSVELIEDDTYVRDAEKACAPSAQKPLRRLSAEELTKRWKHQLCLRHRQRRVVSFSDIPDDATELNGSSTSGGRISKARKSRERRKRSMSWTKLDVDVIPDNVFAEIKEEEFHTSLPCSTGPSDILTAPDGLPPMLLLSDRLQGSQLGSQPHTPQKQQRRQRSQSGGRHRLGSITAESIPHSEACAMLGDGKIVPVDELASLNSGAAGPESSVASSAILRVGATPAPSMATTVASSSDAAGLSPRRGAADPRKGRKRVLKKRLRVRRASTASVDAIPDETPGEVVEHDLDEIDCVARQAVGPPCPDASEPSAGGANRQGSGGRHRIPQPPPQQRKTRTRQLPTKPKLAARSARTQASAATPKTRDAKSGRADLEPVVRAKSRKLSVPRMGSQLLSVAGEEPEVTVGLLREQEIDQQQQTSQEEIRELHISLKQQLQDPADRGRRRSAAPRRGTSAESKSRSRRASAAPRGSAPSSASFGPTNSLDAVSPEGSPEAAEKALVQRALREAQPFLAQAVTQEEVEAAAEPMRYVFEHCDLSRYAASGSGASALLSARLRELEALLQAWIVQRSKGAMQHRATAPANDQAARSCRRLQAADSSGSYENPRRLPLRWAHLTVEELDSDDGLRHLRDSAAPPQRIDSYLAAWSARKQAANEALFATFPFLATLPCGYALTEVGFTNDAEFQHYMRGGAYQESVHVQQQMRDNAQALAEYPEDPQLLDAILAARVKRTNRFLDKRQRLSFVAQSKQESERLIKRMMVRMKKECTSDIPMGMEDVETLRFFFDGVDVDHFGVLDRTDTTDFIMLTLGEEKRMSRTDVERLLFPDVPRGAVLPTLVDFSDFSKFYKKVALQELLKQDSTFDKKVATRATTVPDAGAETSRTITITPRRPEPPSTSPRTGSDRRGRLNTVSSGVLPVRAFAATSSSAAASEAGTVAASANTPRRIGLRRPSSEPHPHHEGSGILHTLQHRHGSAYTPPTSARDRVRVPEGGAVASTDRWFEYGRPSSGHVSAPAGTPPQAEK